MKNRFSAPSKVRKSQLFFACSLPLLALALGGSAFAITATWTGGAATTDWGTAGNWSTAAVPTSTDIANFNLTGIYAVDYTVASTITELVVANPSGTTTLNLSAPMTITNQFVNNAVGALHVNLNSGGQINVGNLMQSQNTTWTINSGGVVSWCNSSANNSFTVNDNSTITVAAGGQLIGAGGAGNNSNLKLSNGAGAATLNVTGGTVTMGSALVSNRGTGTINITSGGTVTVQSASNGITLGVTNNVSTSGAINVTNGTLSNAGPLQVALGTNNATRTAITGVNTVTVNGGAFTQTGTTFLGMGRVGILNVSSGSFTAATSDIIVGGLDKNNLAPTGSAAASGAVNVSGGSLTTTALRVGDSIVVGGANAGYAVPGSLTLTGGTVTTNLLSAGNGANSAVTFSGGTLNTKGTVIANGSVFTVGNGTSAAVLKLDGGTHSFANGIALAANSTLAGTGSITAGALAVAGGATLSPGNSPGTLTVGATTLNGGGNYNWQMLDATGAAGTGFDTINLTAGNVLTLNNTSGNPFNINLWSLSSIGPDVSGDAANFNNALSQSWTLFATDQTISGFSADKFAVNVGAANGTAGFSNGLAGGAFAVALGDGGTDLVLTFTAVPEPAAWLLGAIGCAAATLRRRRGE